MISLSHKKHPTTPPNTRAQISRNRLVTSALLGAACLLLSGNFSNHTAAAELKWGRPRQSRQLTKSTNLQFRSASSLRKSKVSKVTQDAQVATVAWQEDAASDATDNHSILVDRPESEGPKYLAQIEKYKYEDPFGADVPSEDQEIDPNDDPFGEDITNDDPFGEEVPETPQTPDAQNNSAPTVAPEIENDDPFGEAVPKVQNDDPFGENVPETQAKPIAPETPEIDNDDPFGEAVPKVQNDDPFGENVPETQAKPIAPETPEVDNDDPFGEAVPKVQNDDPFGENIPETKAKPIAPETPEVDNDDPFGEAVPKVQNDDPFGENAEDDLMPEFDEEEPVEESSDQPEEQPAEEQPEPTLDDLFEEKTITEEPAEEMVEDQLQDDLFDSDIETNEPTEITPETEPETLEPDTLEVEEPEVEEIVDDPFDEPTIDQLPSKQLPSESAEESLDKEIKRRMDELDSNVLEKEAEKDTEPEDSLDTTEVFDKSQDDEPQDDSNGSKLFGDPENLDIEIGGPIPSGELTEAERQQHLEQLAKERQQSQKNCEDEIAKMKSDRIDDIDLSLKVEGNPGEDYPFECSVGYSTYQPRQWAQITYNWKASGLCHKPLYFEQVQLERYGHSWGPYVQPIMSGAHFFGTLPILPYKMGLKTPNECVYTLGYYRPGSCAPYLVGGVPFTWRAALYQGAATTGLIFAIP